MKFDRKLREQNNDEIWQEYCGFLDLSLDEFMSIQFRLMEEQIEKWSRCGLGKAMLDGRTTSSVEEFRRTFPLTTYEDYADVLLHKRSEMLPDEPIVWIQTTWEGGRHPVKLAPYSKSMLDTYRNNVVSCLILSSSTAKGAYSVEPGNTMLYGLAPLPYATGLLPLLLDDEIHLEYLPPVKEAEKMSFSERNKLGFKLGLKKGIDFFFAVGSVTYYISSSFAKMGGGGSKKGIKNVFQYSPTLIARYISGKKKAAREGRSIAPKDVFRLRGFMCAGTDNRCYKDDLEKLWGIRPVEVFAGTEPGCLGCETWARNGLYFFPDSCFLEFIPESEMERSLADGSYEPQTCLMNEVIAGEVYELVISVFKGGAFMRYRVGDVYRCLGSDGADSGVKLPRFEYIDRIPTVIDIAGFTRITENSVEQALRLSGLQVEDWIACKEFSEENRPYMHIYVEMRSKTAHTVALTREVIREHLSVYFKYLDNDYQDLKKILGIDPLKITMLPLGAFKKYYSEGHDALRRINPPAHEKLAFMRCCGLPFTGGVY